MTGLLRGRSTWLIGAVAVAAVALTVLLGRSGPGTLEPLDPDNPHPDGARAVARVLADQGVQVQVARSAAALHRAAPGAGDTVLVTGAEALGRRAAAQLRELAGSTTVIVAQPSLEALRALEIDAEPHRQRPGAAIAAQCRRWGLTDELALGVDRAAGYRTGSGCFPTRHGHLLAETEAGMILLGAAEILRNDQVTRHDNAAVALRLLGHRGRLIWYVPSLGDLDGADAVGAWSLLPAWIRPALVLLGVSALAAMLWRGRRLGPLETEPLPVQVRAAESTRSLGRLYRRSSDRAHAAAALREAAWARLVELLRPDPGTPPEDLLAQFAAALDRPVDELEALLAPWATAPADDKQLVRLAEELAVITREARIR